MREQIARRNTWIAVGVSVFLLFVMVIAYVQLPLKKARATIAADTSKYEGLKTEADGLPKAQEEQRKAEDKTDYLRTQLTFFRQRYRTLNFGDINGTSAVQIANRQIAWRRWLNEYFSDYGLAVQTELVTAARQTGVVLNSKINVGAPPSAPEQVIVPANGLFRPTGAALEVSVAGPLPSIIRFFDRINDSSILLLVGRDLKLEGESPNITATVSITPYLLAAGIGAPIGTSVTAGAGAAGAGAAGGSSGGMSSGSPSASPVASGSSSSSSSSGSGSPTGSPAP